MPGSTIKPEIVYDEAGRVLDANQAAAELTGIPLGRLRGFLRRGDELEVNRFKP